MVDTTMSAETKMMITKPLTAAIVGGALTSLSFTNRFQVTKPDFLAGKSLSPAVFGALLGVSTHFVIKFVNTNVLRTHPDDTLKNLPSFVTHVVGGGLVFSMVPMLFGQTGQEEMKRLFATGAITEIVSQFVHQQFVAGGEGTISADFANRYGR